MKDKIIEAIRVIKNDSFKLSQVEEGRGKLYGKGWEDACEMIEEKIITLYRVSETKKVEKYFEDLEKIYKTNNHDKNDNDRWNYVCLSIPCVDKGLSYFCRRINEGKRI